ncbi:MAG: hypothetical protein FWH26_04320 [Oscillospiraceae bacterium]|nr:hypothetical protein [Oscillospiraceae bacterium]
MNVRSGANSFEDIVAELMDDEDFAALFGALPPAPQSPERAEAAVTEKQLWALSRRHLFVMIRNLEEELRRERKEKEDLLLAYQAGLLRGWRM